MGALSKWPMTIVFIFNNFESRLSYMISSKESTLRPIYSDRNQNHRELHLLRANESIFVVNLRHIILCYLLQRIGQLLKDKVYKFSRKHNSVKSAISFRKENATRLFCIWKTKNVSRCFLILEQDIRSFLSNWLPWLRASYLNTT